MEPTTRSLEEGSEESRAPCSTALSDRAAVAATAVPKPTASKLGSKPVASTTPPTTGSSVA